MKPERVSKIFDDLETLVIYLPKDPLELGPDYLREQISVCRGYLNTASSYLHELLSERAFLTMKLETKETAFSIRSDELLVEDVKVKTLPSLADRQAMINNILSAERKEIEELRLQLSSLGHIEKVIRLRHKELDNTMSAIRLQRSLLKDQIRTGSFYGDESPEGRDEVDVITGEDLDSFLSDIEDEDPPAPAQPSLEVPPESDDSSEESPSEEEDLFSESTDPSDEGERDVSLGGVSQHKEEASSASSSTEEVDLEMKSFFEQDFEDDLDSLLEGI